MKYRLSSSTWGPEEIEIMGKVISSGNFTMGSEVKEFETNFSNYFQSKYSLMVNSGSSANLLMLQALKYSGYLKPHQNEIIVPAVGWSTTFFPINQAGFKIVFVDIEMDTFNICLDDIKKKINKNTAAILAVNLLGSPSDLVDLHHVCSEFDIFLLEDNCESMGSSIGQKFAGTFGLMGSFSTFFSHHICTMEGGLIVTDDAKLYEILLSLRAHGWIRDLDKDNTLYQKTGDFWSDSFTFILPGYNLRPLELEGALGTVQLKKLKSFVDFRNQNALYLIDNLESLLLPLKLQKSKFESSWFGFGFIISESAGIKRSELIKFLTESEIESRPIVTGNFTRNPVIDYLDYEIRGKLQNSDKLHENGFFIGNHHYPIQTEIDHFLNTLSSFLRGRK